MVRCKRVSFLIALYLCISSVFAFAADNNSLFKTDILIPVEKICQEANENIAFRNSLYSSNIQWDCDGWVDVDGYNDLYRVRGWSTCVDALGTEIYHYTRARFEQFLFGTVFGDSGRVWGVGKVTATGSWCDRDIWLTSHARVYYGLGD